MPIFMINLKFIRKRDDNW